MTVTFAALCVNTYFSVRTAGESPIKEMNSASYCILPRKKVLQFIIGQMHRWAQRRNGMGRIEQRHLLGHVYFDPKRVVSYGGVSAF